MPFEGKSAAIATQAERFRGKTLLIRFNNSTPALVMAGGRRP
jgi:hypothetical protein